MIWLDGPRYPHQSALAGYMMGFKAVFVSDEIGVIVCKPIITCQRHVPTPNIKKAPGQILTRRFLTIVIFERQTGLEPATLSLGS